MVDMTDQRKQGNWKVVIANQFEDWCPTIIDYESVYTLAFQQ